MQDKFKNSLFKQRFQLLKVSIVLTQVLSLIFGFVHQDNLSSQASSVCPCWISILTLLDLNSNLIQSPF